MIWAIPVPRTLGVGHYFSNFLPSTTFFPRCQVVPAISQRIPDSSMEFNSQAGVGHEIPVVCSPFEVIAVHLVFLGFEEAIS